MTDTEEGLTVTLTQEDIDDFAVDWEALGYWTTYQRDPHERLRLFFQFNKDNPDVRVRLQRKMPRDSAQLLAEEWVPWTHFRELSRTLGLLLRRGMYQQHYYVTLKKRARIELQIAIDAALERGWLVGDFMNPSRSES